MNGVEEPKAKTPVVWEHHGTGYRVWCEGPFSRLIFAIPGVVRVKRAPCGGECFEVTLSPRYDVNEIEALVYELAKKAEASPGIGRWLQ